MYAYTYLHPYHLNKNILFWDNNFINNGNFGCSDTF